MDETLTNSNQNVSSIPLPALGIVLRGGGAKGLALLGALAELQSGVTVEVKAYGGTSAGGLVALALASGYSAQQLIPVVRNQSFVDFFDESWAPDSYVEPWRKATVKVRRSSTILLVCRGLIRFALGWLGFRTRGGMFSSEPVGRWMLHLLRWRPRAGILPLEADLQTDTRLGKLASGAMVVASSTGTQNCVTFSSTETPNQDACFAARSTMSIPGVFHPLPLGGELLMDGGMVANFPMEQFATVFPKMRTLGVYLCSTDSSARQRDRSTTPIGILKAVLAVFLGQDELAFVRENRSSVIWIDATPIQTLDFDLADEDKEFLLECGRIGAQRWLRENAHDVIVRDELVLTDQDFSARVERLRMMRLSAFKRWRNRHRNRRLMLTTLLMIPAVSLLSATFAVGFGISRIVQYRPQLEQRVLNVAVVLNGDVEYTKTAARAAQHELQASLNNTSYVARVELSTGYPEEEKSPANQSVFQEIVARFESTPDYLVTIGTQVSIFGKQNYLGKIPLIFSAVTDPIDSGLVKKFDADRSRGNIGGVAYGDVIGGVRFLENLFPGARLGFYYSSLFRQDKVVASRIANCCHEVLLIDDEQNPLRTNKMRNIDLLFGWYYLDKEFVKVRSGFSGAIVAGNESDMTRGAVAMLANNDEEVGALAIKSVLLPNLIGGKGLADIPIVTVKTRTFGINKTLARRHGLTIATLPPGTKEFGP
jgi:predicted acylesterase/phospholipase RssA/ABC-type uncharacterized transport system substrate-binding protein